LNGYSTTCPLQELRQAGCGKSTRTMAWGIDSGSFELTARDVA
jgi:hypothetical protein